MYSIARLSRLGIRHASTFGKGQDVPMLDRPIGFVDPPTPSDNDGIDKRSMQQRKEDWMNYEKHMERRQELEREFGKGFDEVKQFRHSGGKFFAAPTAYFRPDKALYMPNIWGTTLKGEYTTTTPLLKGNITILRWFGAVTGEKQVNSFTDELLLENNVQYVDVNVQENWVKLQMVKLFMSNLRKTIPEERHDQYFIAHKGITNELKRSLRVENPYAGYVFLIDRHCRIRWAACGTATSQERAYLSKFTKSLYLESS